jgi:hypothetical protein
LLFFAVAGVNIILNVRGHFDALGVLVTIASLAGMVAFLAFRHARPTYSVGIIAMGLVLVRAGQSIYLEIREQLHGRGIGWAALAVTCWFVFLLVVLFRSYALGARSRQYYGLPAVPRPTIE